MKKKLFILGVLFAGLITKLSVADEGMWMPFLLEQINYAKMKEMGLELTPEQLYSVNNASLKDAIVMLDGGSCTGEVVSPNGLIFTNHHCGYDDIQAHSSVEHDYLTDGFWAKSYEEELANPGKTVSFLKRVEDVSNQILKYVNKDFTEGERAERIRSIVNNIVDKAVAGTHYEAQVLPMFEGNKYILFVYETFRDVRLVGAPPSSIGEYGGDTDNWMWPRHTGDFSIFRVYADKEGKPADYSPDNIPLETDYFLQLSIKGLEKNDFTMIWGYPGTTDRYLSSYGVEFNLEHYNPVIIEAGYAMLENMKMEMDKSDHVRIQYASKHKIIANFAKLYEGQSKFLQTLNVYESKKKLENEFSTWVDQKRKRRIMYGEVLNDFNWYYTANATEKFNVTRILMMLNSYFGVEASGLALSFHRLSIMLKDNEDPTDYITELKSEAEHFYKDYYYVVDKLNLASLMGIYKKHVPEKYYPAFFETVDIEYDGSFNKYAESVFANTVFKDKESLLRFLEDPNIEVLENDPVYIYSQSISSVGERFMGLAHEFNTGFQTNNRLFLKGLQEMNGDNPLYPDANSTMRYTYGSVDDLEPRDAVYFGPKTYLKGIMEKEDASNPEFIVPHRLKEIYDSKDYGDYGEGDKMPVCFLTNHDITGGSSGSPVMNGKGHLVGLAFDSNWEGVSGDIAFNTNKQRCVNVDIRYVLLVIDKFAGAQNILDELTIVK